MKQSEVFSSSPLIAIVGLTATGKSGLAWQLREVAQELGFEYLDLISVDSRQVYRGLEIVSGADVPEVAHPQHDRRFPFPYFQDGNVRLHGVGILSPTQQWSAAEFQDFARQVIVAATATHGLAVCVGGTGLYYDVLSGQVPLSTAEPNEDIRAKAAELNVEELQAWVQQEAAGAWEKMNGSDRANPRRLVRALERAREPKLVKASELELREGLKPTLTIGLTAPLEKIEENIALRVRERLMHGATQEVQRILEQFPPNDAFTSLNHHTFPALTATGVKEIIAFLREDWNREQLEQRWMTRERQYAKRQLTWWKDRSDVEWFDITEEGWRQRALDRILQELRVYSTHERTR